MMLVAYQLTDGIQKITMQEEFDLNVFFVAERVGDKAPRIDSSKIFTKRV